MYTYSPLGLWFLKQLEMKQSLDKKPQIYARYQLKMMMYI